MNRTCDPGLLDYCQTDRQKEVIKEFIKRKGNALETANAIGIDKSNVNKIIVRVKKQAALKGYSPECDMLHATCDPFVVNGISTLYDKDGNVSAQWVKTKLDERKVKLMIHEFAEEYTKSIPKYVPTPHKKHTYEDRLVVYPLADIHMGMLSWMEETGHKYNTKLAEYLVKEAITRLIDRSPNCAECLICNLGDLFHVDNQVYQTERSGNILDTDSRYSRIFKVGIRVIRYCIEYALQKHNKVTVINSIGNHDDLGSLWLSAALSNIYENEDRIIIMDEPTPRHYYRYGDVLIGCTHGHEIKSKDLPLVMANERSEDWGSTKYRYWYIGHWHQDRVVEVGNCRVEGFRAICAKDAWSNSKGFMSERDVKAIFIDKSFGEVERYTLNINSIDISKFKD